MSITVDHDELASLLFAVSHFPDFVPNRWDLVAEFVRDQPSATEGSFKVCLGETESTNSKRGKHYSLTDKKKCRDVHKILSDRYHETFNSKHCRMPFRK